MTDEQPNAVECAPLHYCVVIGVVTYACGAMSPAPGLPTMRQTRHQYRRTKAWLSEVDWQLGKFMKVAAPTLWLRLTRRVKMPGFDSDEHFVRASIVHDVCRSCMIPRVTAVRQVSDRTRIIADADVLADQFRVLIGQQIPLLDLSNKAGFKRLHFTPEVRLGVDMKALAPTVGTVAPCGDPPMCAHVVPIYCLATE